MFCTLVNSLSPNISMSTQTHHHNRVTPIKGDNSEEDFVNIKSLSDKKLSNFQSPSFTLTYPKNFRNSSKISFIPTGNFLKSNTIHDDFFYHNTFFIQKFWNEHLQKKVK